MGSSSGASLEPSQDKLGGPSALDESGRRDTSLAGRLYISSTSGRGWEWLHIRIDVFDQNLVSWTYTNKYVLEGIYGQTSL